MSISSIISNLQQAKDCAGKCDCCNKLQQQINTLNQRINNIESNYLSKNEKSEIIQSAYYQSVQWAEPKFALVNSEIDGWQVVLQAISASLVLINQFLK